MNIQQLKESLDKVASRISELSLNEGATDLEIEQFEQAINSSLPDDLKQLYEHINGNNQDENFGNFFYGLTFYSIEEAIASWNWRKKFSEDGNSQMLTIYDKEIDGLNLYNSNWIPIATDGSRCELCVDLSPTEFGTYGQIIFLEGTYNIGIVAANSTTKLIEQFIDDLNNGHYYLATDALEDGEHWLETKDTIDLVRKALQKSKASN